MKKIGEGPKPPGTTEEEERNSMSPEEAKAYAVRVRQRMRITYGFRTGLIAGGPQGEAPMQRAGKAKGSYAAMAVAGGCRGCHAKGKWPGEKETTAHAYHECACKNVKDIIQWKADVVRHLKHVVVQVH